MSTKRGNLILPAPPPGEGETSLYFTNITLDRCLECLQGVFTVPANSVDGHLTMARYLRYTVRRVRLQASTF